MKVEMRDVAAIRPYSGNPRHNDHAIASVAASIREFGFRQPIVLDEKGTIVVGDTRFKAALQLGLRSVPVHVASGLTPAQIKAYRLIDNKTAELAEWNNGLLVQELAELQKMEFDISVIGFSGAELHDLFRTELDLGRSDPDQVPDPPDQPVTQPGDLWQLGPHRLLCGDAGRSQDVDRLLDGATVHLVVTDPPYNVKLEPRSRNAIAAGLSSFGRTKRQAHEMAPAQVKRTGKKLRAKDRPLTNDYLSDVEFDKRLHAWFGNMARVLKPGGAFYVWGGYANLANYPPVLKACGLYFSQGIVWNKLHPVLTRKDFMGCFELAFYGWREGAGHRFYGPNNALDLWEIKKVSPQTMVHLTEKPVELAVRAIRYSSLPGENVMDLFGGSGSTLIGAEQTGRRAFLIEVDPLYCDVIVKRWENFTGKKAKHVCAR